MSVATKALAGAQADKPKALPTVIPANVTINFDGTVFRQFFVRLPEGLIADDLKEPGIWSKVQASGSGKALRRHDHIYAVAFDETWAADIVVADANGSQAVLCKPRLIAFPERYENLYQDDKYRVKWCGTGYVVERKSDGFRMTQPAATAGIAERDLIRLYPRVA